MQNNPSKKTKGQSGPRPRTLRMNGYPLAEREQELRGEIQSPTIPTIYERVPTMDLETAPARGTVGTASHNPGGETKSGYSAPPETWDSVAPMSEDNMHAKFVKLGILPEDENLPADFGIKNQPK